MKMIDLTQTMIHNMQVYPGDVPPTLLQTHSIKKDGYTNHQLTMGMHAGTHIDGPWHMTGNKRLIADAPLEHLTGKACVIDIRNTKEFSDAQLVKRKAAGCSVILFYTGYGKFFGLPRYEDDYPLIGGNVAQAITEMEITLIGIDTLSPDLAPYRTHQILLSNSVFIAENLTNLHLLLNEPEFEVIALPLKIAADSAPARVIALIRA